MGYNVLFSDFTLQVIRYLVYLFSLRRLIGKRLHCMLAYSVIIVVANYSYVFYRCPVIHIHLSTDVREIEFLFHGGLLQWFQKSIHQNDLVLSEPWRGVGLERFPVCHFLRSKSSALEHTINAITFSRALLVCETFWSCNVFVSFFPSISAKCVQNRFNYFDAAPDWC